MNFKDFFCLLDKKTLDDTRFLLQKNNITCKFSFDMIDFLKDSDIESISMRVLEEKWPNYTTIEMIIKLKDNAANE